MRRYVIRLLLSAGAFYFLFPLIQGVHFRGNFFHALLAGALFCFLSWIVELGAVAASTILTITTLGLALFFLVPVWLFGFWLLPSVALRLLADFVPNIISFSGWLPAIWGGLIMLAIGILTNLDFHRKIINLNDGRAAA